MSLPEKIGRYEILGELGHGAMGSVFRARDPAIDRIVAVKTILTSALASGQNEEARQRFYREARAAGALAHPGIVPIFDIGEHDGAPFLVMEFVDGQTLGQMMKRGERPSLDRIFEIGQRIAEALGYAHRNGVIHRDIKPANILMTSREIYGEERPRITDFGVAKLAVGELTLTGQFLGTPAFMPPEQFTGEPIDGRTDLFSLGVILYWMATGEQPFPGETMTAVSYKVVHTEPVPPSKLNPAIPEQLEAIISKSLAKSPSNRYQAGEDLAAALAKLRAQLRTSDLRTSVPRTVIPSGESQDTIDSTPAPEDSSRKPALSTIAQASPQPSSARPPQKRAALLLAAVALAAVAAAAAGGYFVMHRRGVPATQTLPAPTDPVASQQSAPSSSGSTDGAPPGSNNSASAAANSGTPGLASDGTPAGQSGAPASSFDPAGTANPGQKPAAGVATNSAGVSSAPAPTVSAPIGASTAPRQKSTVAFDPKRLDPKKNTRLKLDFSHFPPDVGVTVLMDGKVFFKGQAASKADYDGLYAPPGMHEIRVALGGEGVRKTSNSVSAEFVAKKHMTLKVELRQDSKNGSRSARLDAATQVIAALKTDLFPF